MLKLVLSWPVLQPDKGNGVVVMDKVEYSRKLDQILSDKTKFVELACDPTADLESKLNNFLYNLKRTGKIDESTFHRIRSVGACPGRIYGLPKTHKMGVPLRPIVSCVGTYSYNLAQYLVELLQPFSHNSFTVKDSFAFAKEVTTCSSFPFMASFGRPDKGNGVVVMDKVEYSRKLDQILSDKTKFVELACDPTADLESKLNNFLYNLKRTGKIDESTFHRIRSVGACPGRIYGLPKTHKMGVPLRPIVSCVGTYSYNLAQYLVELLQPFSHNSFTVKDSFAFAKEVTTCSSFPFMASFGRPDKGNGVVVMDKVEYSRKLDQILSDKTKFVELACDPTADLESKLNNFLYNLKRTGKIDESTFHRPDQLVPVLVEYMDYLRHIRWVFLFVPLYPV